MTSQWDLAGRRTKLTHPDGFYVDQDYLVTGETTKLRENGASSGVGVLATYSYDDLGRRTNVLFGNGAAQAFTFDPVSRLASLSNDLTGTVNDLSATFTHNPASQIASTVRTGDAYAWTGHGQGTTASVPNGLNQLASIGGAATDHDDNGNLTLDPTSGKTYGYSSENLLTSASGGVTLGYDPLLRLHQVAGAATTRFAYDGLDMIAEYDGANTRQRRFVHGPGMDQPVVWYEGSGTTDRRFLSSDERGSIISLTDSSGALLNLNRYDEYGKPQATNAGRFGYTGQMWLGELGLWHYKARMYSPTLGGRFLQTDPIGMRGGINLYAYVGNDPINFVDPLGLDPNDIVVTAPYTYQQNVYYGVMGFALASNLARQGAVVGDRGVGDDAEEKPKVPCTPTPEQMKDSGQVTYDFTEGSLAFGLFYSHIEGRFETAGGYSGRFETSATGLFFGSGTGVAEGFGTSQSLATFTGANYNIVGTLGPIDISDNFSTDLSHVGQTDAAATPGLGIGATKSNTTISDVICPQ